MGHTDKVSVIKQEIALEANAKMLMAQEQAEMARKPRSQRISSDLYRGLTEPLFSPMASGLMA